MKLIAKNIPDTVDFPVLAIDPGDTSGWAFIHKPSHYDVVTGRYRWPDDAAELQYRLEKSNLVVAEDFKLFPHLAKQQTGSHFVAARVLGFVEGLCHIHDHPLVKYYSNQTKTITDKLLAQCIDTMPKNRHERDALRVFVLHLLKENK